MSPSVAPYQGTRLPRVLDVRGNPVALDVRAALGTGGEGSVFAVQSDPSRVGKLYARPSPVHGRKLNAILRVENQTLSKVCAWPEATLHDPRSREVVGFLMRRAAGSSLSELLGPKARREHFPEASFRFVVRAAKNLARAFQAAHNAGVVVGDVKELNALVAADATITLLDADGFQFCDPTTGEVFPTLAVTPSHQPPELQSLGAETLPQRTPQHDAFGLAVLVFQLLFMGRHPFSGTPVTRVDLEIHEAIKVQQFAWAVDLPNRLYRPPPYTVGLADVGRLGPLFTRAFLGAPSSRPTAADWAFELGRYERDLRQCAVNQRHQHLGATCTLCEIEGATGAVLFVRPQRVAAAGFDVAAAWRAILEVTSPGPAPECPGLSVAPSGAALNAPAQHGVQWLMRMFRRRTNERALEGAPTGARSRAARERLDDLKRTWGREAGSRVFDGYLSQLAAARDRLHKLETVRKGRLQELHRSAPARQLERHLRMQSIAAARLSGVTAKQLDLLRGFRIETAADVTDYELGWLHAYPALQSALRDWRRQIEATFRYTAKGPHPDDVAALDWEFASARFEDEQTLRRGPAELRRIAQEVERRRAELSARIAAAQSDLAESIEHERSSKA